MTNTQILDRAQALSWPMFACAGGAFTGETAWRQHVAVPGYAPQLEVALAEAEAERARWAAFSDEEARRDADRRLTAIEPGSLEAEMAAQFLADARAAQQRDAGFMTFGQARELIELQRGVLAELRKR